MCVKEMFTILHILERNWHINQTPIRILQVQLIKEQITILLIVLDINLALLYELMPKGSHLNSIFNSMRTQHQLCLQRLHSKILSLQRVLQEHELHLMSEPTNCCFLCKFLVQRHTHLYLASIDNSCSFGFIVQPWVPFVPTGVVLNYCWVFRGDLFEEFADFVRHGGLLQDT